jgi:hypothetical protein
VFIDEGLVALHHDGFYEGDGRDGCSHALDEVDAVFFGATLQDLAVGGAGHLLNREVANTVVEDRVNGHPIALFEPGVVVPEGAQDDGVLAPPTGRSPSSAPGRCDICGIGAPGGIH